ncbi:2Fe-2S iron-sulfur cluster-binding protein [Aestuariicoccus sp. MJ-SS9]|uniref:2Fe-2S iron-sulfur cluster-binding protein n=1 Tax=Aestuariicoccus sp. MJ-SS9 TaxID=3079855 RepID=UPI00290D2FC4|nr:2Fe-2S iron-sulfur cluster-binding protein [Aestuariicoccus sp. MJ-SS9]MDU8912259.1 FAD-binding oxidoreductase [Aestuariicoccus sp. MJ-SS9]
MTLRLEKPATVYEVGLRPQGPRFPAFEGNTILSAAIDHNVAFPHGCKMGRCGLCKSRLIEGEVLHREHSESALTRDETASGLVLPCVAAPVSDLSLVPVLLESSMPGHELREFGAHVTAVEKLTHDIMLVRLRPEDGPLEFAPGQYSTLSLPDGTARDYSMANRSGAPELEFHIRKLPGGRFSQHVHTRLEPGDVLRVKGPLGAAHLRTNHDGPILAVAGGSGLAPIKSIVESAVWLGMRQPIHVYFGAREERDLYLMEHFEALGKRHPGITFTPVLSNEPEGGIHQSGLVHDALVHDLGDLSGWKAYAAGPPAMVEAVTARAIAANLSKDDMHADAFFTGGQEKMTNQDVRSQP